MLTLPAERTRFYETLLRQQGVAREYRPHYAKWLRYYWDFCHKYGFEPWERQSFPPFDEKLRAKNQSVFQRQQPRTRRRFLKAYGGVVAAAPYGRRLLASVSLLGKRDLDGF